MSCMQWALLEFKKCWNRINSKNSKSWLQKKIIKGQSVVIRSGIEVHKHWIIKLSQFAQSWLGKKGYEKVPQ